MISVDKARKLEEKTGEKKEEHALTCPLSIFETGIAKECLAKLIVFVHFLTRNCANENSNLSASTYFRQVCLRKSGKKVYKVR